MHIRRGAATRSKRWAVAGGRRDGNEAAVPASAVAAAVACCQRRYCTASRCCWWHDLQHERSQRLSTCASICQAARQGRQAPATGRRCGCRIQQGACAAASPAVQFRRKHRQQRQRAAQPGDAVLTPHAAQGRQDLRRLLGVCVPLRLAPPQPPRQPGCGLSVVVIISPLSPLVSKLMHPLPYCGVRLKPLRLIVWHHSVWRGPPVLSEEDRHTYCTCTADVQCCGCRRYQGRHPAVGGCPRGAAAAAPRTSGAHGGAGLLQEPPCCRCTCLVPDVSWLLQHGTQATHNSAALQQCSRLLHHLDLDQF